MSTMSTHHFSFTPQGIHSHFELCLVIFLHLSQLFLSGLGYVAGAGVFGIASISFWCWFKKVSKDDTSNDFDKSTLMTMYILLGLVSLVLLGLGLARFYNPEYYAIELMKYNFIPR